MKPILKCSFVAVSFCNEARKCSTYGNHYVPYLEVFLIHTRLSYKSFYEKKQLSVLMFHVACKNHSMEMLFVINVSRLNLQYSHKFYKFIDKFYMFIDSGKAEIA